MGATAAFFPVAFNILIAILGIVALAASVSGYWFAPLNFGKRTGLLVAAAVFFLTHSSWGQLVAFILVAAIGFFNWRSRNSLLEHQ